MSKRYIIVGSGIAGLSAARAIREDDSNGQIIMFSAEDNLPYSRPMLTKAPFISFNPDDWTLYDEDWFMENKIELHLGEPVTKVDTESKAVTTSEGSYSYDKLIIASGAESFVPPFNGRDKKGIFTIRRAEDIINIKKAYHSHTRAVVIGGGVIGLEAAVELARYGASVTVLESMPYLMTRQIDNEISDIICVKLGELGMEVHTGVQISSLDGDTWVESVSLADGRIFPCDFVVVACGVRAVTSMLPDTIDVPRAIAIDDHCRTSAEDVYAAGDCAQYNGVNYALWSQGLTQGYTAGKNAAGGDVTVGKTDTSLVMNSLEMSLFALGDLGKNPDAEYTSRYRSSKDSPDAFLVNPPPGEFFEKRYISHGKVVGAAIVGNLSGMQELKDKINNEEETE